MQTFVSMLVLVASAQASFEAANSCTDIYFGVIEGSVGADKCVVVENFAKCLGEATVDLQAAAMKSYDRQLETAQNEVAPLGCDSLVPESPSINVKDGNVEVKVARRDADVKFYRYGRTADVSIFDLDTKVTDMKGVVEAAVASAVAAQNTAVQTVSEMNAAFVLGVSEKVADTDVAVLEVVGDVKSVKSAVSAVQSAMDSFKVEINQKVSDDSAKLATDLTSLVEDSAEAQSTSVAASIKEANAANKVISDRLTASVANAFTQACLAGGQKYNTETKKCEGEVATAGDGKTPESAATSCKAIKSGNSKAATGLYWVRPSKASSSHRTYCEMSYAGGGWTLVASVNEGDIGCRGCSDDRWSNPHHNANNANNYQAKNGGTRPWETDSHFGDAAAASNDDFKSPLYAQMTGVQNMMVMSVPNDTPYPQWTSAAYVVQHTTSNWLKQYGNLKGFYNSYPLRYGCPKQGPNNIKVVYDKGNDGTVDGIMCPNCRGQTQAGYWSFSRCNWESSMFAFCMNKANGRDNEHFCVGAPYVHGHGGCAANDFSAWDWSCAVTNYNSGWHAQKKQLMQTMMFLYRE